MKTLHPILLITVTFLQESFLYGLLPLNGDDEKRPFSLEENNDALKRITTVRIESIPHHALIVYGGYYCSGSLIRSQIILSAASCFLKRNKQKIVVKLGANTMTEPGQVLPVLELKTHEYFDHNRNWNNDIALLVLEEHVQFSNCTKKILLVEPGTINHVGIQLEVAGWAYSDRRLYDNGGGAVNNDRLVGIVSFGGTSKKQPHVAVLTNISYYYKWITLNSKRVLEKYCRQTDSESDLLYSDYYTEEEEETDEAFFAVPF